MQAIKQHSLPALLKWQLIVLITLFPLQAANSVEPWAVRVPDNQTFVILFLWLLGIFILGFSLYRILLKNQIRQGVHPHIWRDTLIFFITGLYLLVLFLQLFDQIGLGWFAAIGFIYMSSLLMWIILGKALRPLIFFLVIMVAIVALTLVNV
jgi:hypothetical protein